MVLYKFKQGIVGMSNFYLDNRTPRGLANYKDTIPLYVVPFLQAKFGPVAVQAEFLYQYGERKYESPSTTEDRDIRQMAGWIDATADFGMFYVGGSGAYISGDDFSTDKIEGGNLTGGRDWNPCLIMFNSDRQYWAGNQDGHNATANGAPMTNAYFAQLRAGVRPIDKLDIMASVSYATADKTPQAVWDSREYGYEIDLTATYKLTNNLSYMLGGGYWIVGDYYKGTAAAGQDVDDNFMVINKLTLTF